jgi:peptidoglycan/LPS O-acetylase OafA/YrhL
MEDGEQSPMDLPRGGSGLSQPDTAATAEDTEAPSSAMDGETTGNADAARGSAAHRRSPEGPSPFKLGNRPCLTGVRALGITAVLVYHSNFKTLPGAWAMLQVFFVLSGFLITAMLNSEGRRNGRISLKAFYSRRVVRLLPPLALTIVLMGIYASFVSVADASQRIWGDSAAAFFYYFDYRQAFGHEPFFGFLAQCWSLAVEEQFYIIWSVLMVAAVAVGRRRLAYVLATVGIALSVGDRMYLALRAPHFNTVVFTRVYYAFDTRADALLVGCLLGLLASDGYLNNWKPWTKRMVAVGAIASTAFMMWILFSAPLFTEALVVWQLPATTFACAIVIVYFVVCPEGLGSRAVGIGILVFIGNLSYTIYIVHFPVYLAIQPNGTHWSFWPTELVRLAIIFGIAIASWFAIERPLMRWRQRSAIRSGAVDTPVSKTAQPALPDSQPSVVDRPSTAAT